MLSKLAKQKKIFWKFNSWFYWSVLLSTWRNQEEEIIKKKGKSKYSLAGAHTTKLTVLESRSKFQMMDLLAKKKGGTRRQRQNGYDWLVIDTQAVNATCRDERNLATNNNIDHGMSINSEYGVALILI